VPKSSFTHYPTTDGMTYSPKDLGLVR